MGTVTIAAETFTVYGTTAGLASRANGSSTHFAAYTAAVAADPDDVNRKHVEATNLIAALPFEDAANADPSTATGDVVTACYELVLAAILDASVLTAASTGSNVKKLEAKGVSIENFAPVAGSRFPARVMALLGPLLEGATSTGSSSAVGAGGYVSGTSTCSDFDPCDRYGLTEA